MKLSSACPSGREAGSGKGRRESVRHPGQTILHRQVGDGESALAAFELREEGRKHRLHNVTRSRAVERAVLMAAAEGESRAFGDIRAAILHVLALSP